MEGSRSDTLQSFICARTRHFLETLSVNLESKGGMYLAQTVEYMLTEPDREIADALELLGGKYGIGRESIRAAMRYAVTQAWQQGNPDIQCRYFGNSVEFKRRKPTESAFIATAVMHLRHDIYAYTHKEEDPNSGIPPEMRDDIL